MKKSWNRWISVVLSVAMVFVLAAPAMAADSGAGSFAVTPYPTREGAYDKLPHGSMPEPKVKTVEGLSAPAGSGKAAETTPEYADDEVVRASIVLSAPSTLENYSTSGIASNIGAMNYRGRLIAAQKELAGKISAQVLDGEALDVVWNLTLAANIISANVPYGKLGQIKRMPGVKNAFVETRYTPDVVSVGGDDPHMGTSGVMIGSSDAYASGYTGAGSLIAIIDTGLDIEHQSFDADAFDYSLSELSADVDLLTAQEVASSWSKLNIASIGSADGVYRSTKIPFGVNYVDLDLDVTHMHDRQGEHGTHVAGIAAANRYLKQDGKYVSALDSVFVQGVAPDAQIMIMKVFGKGGGAYDSDYMAAIEDAIILGADSVNLSLGSGSAGMATSSEYQDIMESLVDSDTVVVMSAGNAGYWAEQTYYGDLLYDGVNYATNGSPGSYTNSLTVASADNTGFTGAYLIVDDTDVFYTETSGYGNAPMSSIAGEHEYVYVDGPGVSDNELVGVAGEDAFFDLGSEILSGKIAVCNRGSSSFFAKANAAAAQGAVGVIIVNNQPGTISMNLTGYKFTVPAVSITQNDGALLKTGETEANGVSYYTGTLTVGSSFKTNPGTEDSQVTISSFSSWGVPGDLSLKPEITAPGGSIYSVWGANIGTDSPTDRHDAYEQMSGTSMAAPQVSGMAALVAQYIRENGLAEKTGLTVRALTNSLLMGTAVPLFDEFGYYYPVLQQGAGLANVGAAVSAHSYILMNEDATKSYADGKVKAELGDDPDRTGEYSFSFSLNNLTDTARDYAVALDLFTQYKGSSYGIYFSFTDTDYIDATASIAGTQIAVGYDTVTVTVPANGSVTVDVEISGIVDSYDYGTGMWIEGYLYADEVSSDGTLGDSLSIPVLGYYGSWTEPSMTDRGNVYGWFFENANDYPPYLYGVLTSEELGKNAALYNQYFNLLREGSDADDLIGFNPLDYNEYSPERAAVKSGDTIDAFVYSLIRNAADKRFSVTDENGNILHEETFGPEYAAYYDVNRARWYNIQSSTDIGYNPEGKDGDWVNFNFTFAPEYYLNNGEIDWDSVHENATHSIGAYIDNIPPEVVSDAEVSENGLVVNVQDNLYVAGVLIYDPDTYLEGADPLAYQTSQDQEPGDALEYLFTTDEVDTDTYKQFVIEVVDYAGNITTYIVNTDEDAEITEIRISEEEVSTLVGSSFTLNAMVFAAGIDDRVIWKTSDPSVVTVDPEETCVLGPDGVTVNAVGEGTATVKVISVGNPRLAATCEVTVKSVEAQLRGVVWDEDGKVWYSGIDVNGIPEYEQIAAVQDNIPIVAAAMTQDGTLYASSLDDETGEGVLYTADPDTFELTYVADLPYGLMDIAPMPLTQNLIGPYVSYLMIYTEEGQFNSYFDLGLGSLVGITYAYSDVEMIDPSDFEKTADGDGSSEIEVDADFFFVLGQDGTLYLVSVFEVSEDVLGCNIYTIGTIGKSVDYDYFQSLYYNGQYIFWTRFSESENDVDMIIVDAETGDVYEVGSYNKGVWPVAALFEYDNTTEPEQNTKPNIPPYLPIASGISMPIDFEPSIPEQPPVDGEIPPYIPYLPAPGTTPTKPTTPSTPVTPGTDPVTPVTPGTDPSDSGLPFVDVPETSDLYDTIKFVFDNGLMAGISDTMFDLEGNLTRGMIVSILYRNEGSPEITYTGRFSDVAEDAWYAAGVEWAATIGIAAGYEDGRFGPNDPVTREQLAAFLFRYANWKGYEIKTADLEALDLNLISEYALESVKWAAANGILLITDGNIRPTELAKRWEIAVAIKAFIENVAK